MIKESGLPASQACQAFSISRPTYYRWSKEDSSDLDIILRPIIQGIALEFPKYGYRRMAKELERRGCLVNHKKVLRIMKEDNLLCIRKKFRPITTQSDHGLRVYPNLIKGLVVISLNQIWVADITYIRLPGEFIYLAAIIDIYSRKCVGWDLGRNVDAQLTLNALNMAVTERQHLGFSGLIHHSDRGVQYASKVYVERLNGLGINISMSDKGNAYDNAFAESFMKTLKVEEVYMNEYRTFEEAFDNIKEFINEVYNNKRLHSSIGYVPPAEFEQEIINTTLT